MISKKVLLITTGGTIAGNVAATQKEGARIKSSDEFSELLSNTLDTIKEKSGIDVEIEHCVLCDVDSSDIMPENWVELADKIKESYFKYDAFIITHGTNTLSYTASALSFSLANLDKPVILTGSQIPAGMPGSDAVSNLENSLRVAVLQRQNVAEIQGVIVVFGSFIVAGTKVKKSTEFDYDAFEPFGGGAIGRIGRTIDIDDTSLKKHVEYLVTPKYPSATTKQELICINEFDMRIASLTEFPGMDPSLFQNMVNNNDLKGFIFRAFGAGDASTKLVKPVFEYLKQEKIPIVVTTQVPNGNSNFQVNEPGQYLADHKLAIPAYNMSIEAQTTKLAWLLAQKKNGELTYEQVCAEMVTDIRGEIKVTWEVNV